MNNIIRRLLVFVLWPFATIAAAIGFLIASAIAWIVLVIDSIYLMYHKDEEEYEDD